MNHANHSHTHDHDHAHAHGHGGHHHHGPGGHAHGVTDARRLLWAFAVIAVFMLVEIVGGILSGSLALLADAGHMASDAVALAFSWLAVRIGQKAATEELSYGFRRIEILAAFVNGLALFVIAGWIVIEAIQRWITPQPIQGSPMLAVAIAGLVANIVAFLVLFKGSHDNLNMRSALLHVMGDLLGSLAAIVAALIILWTGWLPIDPILSVLVAVIILKSAWSVVRSAGHILLEGSPPDVSIAAIKKDIEENVPQAGNVHHVHVWSITAERHLLTMHVVPQSGATAREVIEAVNARLSSRFGIDHITIQVEEGECCSGPQAPHTECC